MTAEKKDVTINLGGSTGVFLIILAAILYGVYYTQTAKDAAAERVADSFNRDVEMRERVFDSMYGR